MFNYIIIGLLILCLPAIWLAEIIAIPINWLMDIYEEWKKEK